MAENIETYLRELQAALAGADPALIQDALFDAEEHLRSELAAVEAGRAASGQDAADNFAAVVEAYGTPEEVAAAYLAEQIDEPSETAVRPDAPAVESTHLAAAPDVTAAPEGTGLSAAGPVATGAQPSLWARFFGVVIDPRVYKTLLYMLVSLGTGIAFFTFVVTGLSLSAGLMVLIVGVPILLLFLGAVRGLSFLEGRMVEILLGTRMPRRPRSGLEGAGLVQRVWFWVKDGRTWLAMVYMVLQLPLGIIYFTLAVTGLAVGAWMIAAPFAQIGLGHTWVQINGTHEYLFGLWALPLLVIAGAVLLVAWLHLIKWIGRGHAAYAKAMLVRLAK